jgi:hypothetical protein
MRCGCEPTSLVSRLLAPSSHNVFGRCFTHSSSFSSTSLLTLDLKEPVYSRSVRSYTPGVLSMEVPGGAWTADYLTRINLPTNSTVARLLTPVDPTLIAWSAMTLTASSPTPPPELPPELLTNDHRVGNSAEYAASGRGRDSPSAAFASPANKRETYWLTRSNGSEAAEFDFWTVFSFDLWFLERGSEDEGSAWRSVKMEVSSQKARLSPCTVCSICGGRD